MVLLSGCGAASSPVTTAALSAKNTPGQTSEVDSDSTSTTPLITTSKLTDTPTSVSANTTATFTIIAPNSTTLTTFAVQTTALQATNTLETTTAPTFTPVIAPTPTPYVPANPAPNAANRTMPPATTLPTIVIVAATFPPGVTPDTEEQKFIQLLNTYRIANGSPPLAFESHLFQSARWMAQDMATKNYVQHIDSLKRNPFQRIPAFGYPSSRVGENIAGGFELAQDNLAIWQSDQVHKDNLLGKYYTKAGAARFYSQNSLNHWYWVLDLGG